MCASYIFRSEPKKGSATEEVPDLAWGETPDLTIYEMPFTFLFRGLIMKKIKEKIKNFWLKVTNYMKYIFTHPKDTLLPICLAEIIFWIPVWVSALLAVIISPWWWIIAGSVITFWCLPLTPAIGLQIGFIVFFERMWNKRKNKKQKIKKEGDEKDGRK